MMDADEIPFTILSSAPVTRFLTFLHQLSDRLNGERYVCIIFFFLADTADLWCLYA